MIHLLLKRIKENLSFQTASKTRFKASEHRRAVVKIVNDCGTENLKIVGTENL